MTYLDNRSALTKLEGHHYQVCIVQPAAVPLSEVTHPS